MFSGYVNRTKIGIHLIDQGWVLYMCPKSNRYCSFRFSQLSALYGWDLKIGAYKLDMNFIFRGLVQ